MEILAYRFVRFVPTGYRRIVLVGVIAVVAIGCMATYGSLSMDRQVGEDFRQGVRTADTNYYYAGRDTMPYAIIGIDARFTVPSRYWIPAGSDSEKMVKMSKNIYGESHVTPHGAHILAPDGTVVGVWYSNLRRYSIIVNKTDRTVLILFDNPEKDSRIP